MTLPLPAEEALLWHCARTWREPAAPPGADHLDWAAAVRLGVANKMAGLLDGYLRATGLREQMPAEARESLRQATAHLEGKAAAYSQVVATFMPWAGAQGIAVVPLKGLWLSCHLYGRPTIRPGHDLDVLVPRGRVGECLDILEQMGFGRYWPAALADDFYLRHHLHLELSLPDCQTWVEVHWAFDHPRTRLTIDYEAVFGRASPATLLGAPLLALSPADSLLYLAIHLVKHALYLPAVVGRPDLGRIMLADGRLLALLDVAEALRRYQGELDWGQTAVLARQWGATAELRAVLQAARDLLGAPVPASALEALAAPSPGRLTRRLMAGLAEHRLAGQDGRQQSRLWRLLAAENYTFIFRPIRLLDLLAYAAPGGEYLRRRYGRAGLLAAARHLLSAGAQVGRLAWDTVYYTARRRLRPPAVFNNPAGGRAE